jgi:hypothetical protein
MNAGINPDKNQKDPNRITFFFLNLQTKNKTIKLKEITKTALILSKPVIKGVVRKKCRLKGRIMSKI